MEEIKSYQTIPGKKIKAIRIDIKDYYLSGEHEQLAQYAAKVIPEGPRRGLVQKVLFF